ncbi:hypothetical protein EI546_05565 [Aequorivita sp. H23M31]|uniref:Uncharacterized protein n=1 Tax=Aequorivita ciconiae TaxID=2494375 RepID=A0A410G1S2_9FLAO|nr:hypothetical protein [Aequorivita sp. H23M31]QAA81227.1 hypothetical protein EI546_05565 [Aequorivita sp. H23M31]
MAKMKDLIDREGDILQILAECRNAKHYKYQAGEMEFKALWLPKTFNYPSGLDHGSLKSKPLCYNQG